MDPRRPFTPADLELPLAESPFLEERLEQADLSPAEADRVRAFARDGYAILEDLELDDFPSMAERIRTDLAPRYEGENRRVLDAWMTQADVRAIASSERVMAELRLLFGREPVPFQTLNFDVGTEQEAHSDLIHFNSMPRRFVAGVWVALETIDADNGPLFYYPGSHQLPDYQLADLGLPGHPDVYPRYTEFVAALLRTHGFERREVRLEPGQALIWSANLVHGGMPVRDRSRTRHSQVTHCYFEDCAYYIPLMSDFPHRLHARELIDVRTGEFVQPVLGGYPLDLDQLADVWRYPRPLPEGLGRPR